MQKEPDHVEKDEIKRSQTYFYDKENLNGEECTIAIVVSEENPGRVVTVYQPEKEKKASHHRKRRKK